MRAHATTENEELVFGFDCFQILGFYSDYPQQERARERKTGEQERETETERESECVHVPCAVCRVPGATVRARAKGTRKSERTHAVEKSKCPYCVLLFRGSNVLDKFYTYIIYYFLVASWCRAAFIHSFSPVFAYARARECTRLFWGLGDILFIGALRSIGCFTARSLAQWAHTDTQTHRQAGTPFRHRPTRWTRAVQFITSDVAFGTLFHVDSR